MNREEDLAEPGPPPPRARLLDGPALALGATTLLAVAAVVVSRAAHGDERDRRAEQVVEQVTQEVNQTLREALDGAQGIQAFVASDGTLEGSAFVRFARSVTRDGRPTGMAIETVIADDERAGLERRLGVPVRESAPEGGLRPSRVHPRYAPVIAVHPPSARGALGFDLLNDPVRGVSARQARRRGRTVLTPPVDLSNGRQRGVTAIIPLPAPSAALPTAPGSPRTVAFVTLAFSAEDLRRAVDARLPAGVRWQVRDGDSPLLGVSTVLGGGRSRTLSVPGRRWTVVARSTTLPQDGRTPLVVVLGLLGIVGTAWVGRSLGRVRGTEREAARHSAALVHAAEELGGTLDLDAVLTQSMGLVLPRAGDMCVIDQLQPDGELHRVAADAVDRAQRDVLLSLPPLRRTAVIDELLSSGQPLRVRGPQPAALDAYAADAQERALRAGLQLNDVILIPLLARGRTYGLMTIAASGDRTLDDVDESLLIALAHRCAVALESAQRYGHQRDSSLILQLALLPDRLLSVPGLQLGAHYAPAVADTQAGGDFYDTIPLADGRLAVFLGDVVGRGLHAAAIMGQFRSVLRSSLLEQPDPAAALQRLDAFAAHTQGALGSTAIVAIIDAEAHTVTWASSGHLPPLLIGEHAATALRNEHRAPPLGLGIHPTNATAAFPVGAQLLLYSDGLVEERHRSLDISLEELIVGVGPARGTAAATRNAVLAWYRGRARPADDVAFMVIGHHHS